MRKSLRTSQQGTQNLKTHNRTTQKTYSSTDLLLIDQSRWTIKAKLKQFNEISVNMFVKIWGIHKCITFSCNSLICQYNLKLLKTQKYDQGIC